MKQPLLRLGLALALGSGLFLTGCDDDNDNPTTPSSPAPVQPSPTPTPSAAPTPAPSPTPAPGNQPGASANFLGKLKTNEPPLLRIGGQDVMVDQNTTYDNAGNPITLADIPLGTVVRVRGNFMDDRTTVLATRINIPPPDDSSGQQ
jgi:hypothetical protein